MDIGICADGVTKRFGSILGLRGATIHARRGISVVIGPNGAGKSTLLRCIGGLYRPEAGTVRVFGRNPYSDDEARKRVSLLSDNYALYDRLTVRKNLVFFGRLYGNSDADTMETARGILKELGAYGFIDKIAGELSRGTKQKVAICRSLLGKPDAFLLDEPTAFLDAVSAQSVQTMLEDLASQGKTILYATQRLNEAVKMGSAIFIMKNGRVSGRLDHAGLYADALRGARVDIKLAGGIDAKFAARIPHCTGIRGSSISIRIRNYKDINESVEWLIGNGAYVVGVDYAEPLVEKMLGDGR